MCEIQVDYIKRALDEVTHTRTHTYPNPDEHTTVSCTAKEAKTKLSNITLAHMYSETKRDKDIVAGPFCMVSTISNVVRVRHQEHCVCGIEVNCGWY